MAKELLVSDAAALLGVSRQRIDQFVREGRIRVVRHEQTAGRGRRWLSAADVKRLARQKEGRDG
jgi:excisionase family DNA binding protein